MRDSDADTIAALQAAPARGIAPRSLVWITAQKLSDGTTASFGFWNEHLPVTMDVVSGEDGTVEARTYHGDGGLLGVDNIKLTSDISIRTTAFRLSMIHPTTRTLWGEYRLKLAKVQIHRVPLDVVTQRPVALPRCRFLGVIDTAPLKVPKTGGDGSLTINCVSTTAELTITNPAKRSDQTQQRRSGDRHSIYANVVNQWEIYWGGNKPS